MRTHSLRECAFHFGKEHKTIHAYCKKHGITFTKESKEGSKNPAFKHGLENTKLCNTYRNMVARCSNPNRKDYKYYGGRGISAFKEWKDNILTFFAWVKNNGYSDTLTLDRKDVNGDYSPANCRWITVKEQCNNRRTNHLLTHKGVTKTMTQWADEMGMTFDQFRSYLKSRKLDGQWL